MLIKKWINRHEKMTEIDVYVIDNINIDFDNGQKVRYVALAYFLSLNNYNTLML